MNKYKGIFSTSGDVQTAINNEELLKPYVAYVEDEGVIDWNTVVNYADLNLTLEIVTGGTIIFAFTDNTVEYNVNSSAWSYADGNTINVNAGDKIELRGNYNTNIMSAKVGGTAYFKAYGNILSISNGSLNDRAFRFFFEQSNIVDASNLVFPDTTLAWCYYSMFKECTSLVIGPTLPAEVVMDAAYNSMFNGCTSLTYVKCLATDISRTWAVFLMFGVIYTNGTLVKNPFMDESTWRSAQAYIPSSWTIVDNA